MRINPIYLRAIATSILVVPAFLGIRACNTNTVGNSRILPTEASDSNSREGKSNQIRSQSTAKRSINNKQKGVQWNWNDFMPLDWTIDELDNFLKYKSTELTGSEMASLMNQIYPEPKGAPDTPNRLKSGSIPLRKQMQLCLKYINPEDQPSVFAEFWVKYRNSNALDDYRRDVLEQIPSGDYRVRAVTDYYTNRFKDYSDIVKFLTSRELAELRSKTPENLIRSTISDYNGVIYAISGSLRQALERGNATSEEIIATLKSSELDEESKISVIRSIDKRSKDMKLMQEIPK